MNTNNRKVALRIGIVSLCLAALASTIAWYVSSEQAEEQVVAFAREESNRVLASRQAIRLDGPEAAAHATDAAAQLIGGLFDIAEIYDPAGRKLAESLTADGEAIERRLPRHARPGYAAASYESLWLADGRHVLRVMVPLRATPQAPVTGYFEGVRIVPDWQQEQIRAEALVAALMACFASLACGGAIYPVVVHLSGENERKARQVLESHVAMMEALGRAIAKRDSDTGAHNYRVAWISAMLGETLGLRGAAMQSLILGSFLHDAGKIGIPDAILLKPGRLDEREMQIMRSHVDLGEDIVAGAGWLDGAREVVAGHHEKWDGTGYPRGLAGADIPLAARIFAVADVFDALCSPRPYKPALPFDAVMGILQEGHGKHFDPAVLDAFAALAPQLRARLEGMPEESVKQLMSEMVLRHFELLVA